MILTDKYRCPECSRFAWVEIGRGEQTCGDCQRRRELAEADAEIEQLYREEGGEG